MIIGVINVSMSHQYTHPQGRTSPFSSYLSLKQEEEVHQGGTKHRLDEIHRLLKDMFHLPFLAFNLTINPRVKH